MKPHVKPYLNGFACYLPGTHSSFGYTVKRVYGRWLRINATPAENKAWFEAEIDFCLAERIFAEKKGLSIIAGLMTERLLDLVTRLDKVES